MCICVCVRERDRERERAVQFFDEIRPILLVLYVVVVLLACLFALLDCACVWTRDWLACLVYLLVPRSCFCLVLFIS